MFVGMCFGLIMHWAVLCFRIPFPGYDHSAHVVNSKVATNSSSGLNSGRPSQTTQKQTVNSYGAIESGETDTLLAPPSTTTINSPKTTPVWLYFFLAVPAIFDVGATMLCMMGLVYIDVSIYQLLRGSGIIFVALMKQHGTSRGDLSEPCAATYVLKNHFMDWEPLFARLLLTHLVQSWVTNCSPINGLASFGM